MTPAELVLIELRETLIFLSYLTSCIRPSSLAEKFAISDFEGWAQVQSRLVKEFLLERGAERGQVDTDGEAPSPLRLS